MIEWEYKGTFLEQFEPSRRSYITNIFCYAYRGGDWIEKPHAEPAKDLTEMLNRVTEYCQSRIALAHHADGHAELKNLLSLLSEDETKNFCRFIAKREQMHRADKEKAKTTVQQTFVNKAMQTKPPSIKQLDFLKQLGCEIRPGNMHEASVLIEQYKKRAA